MKKKPIATDMLNEARRDMTDVLEELGAVCMHLREAMDFAENGSCASAVASVEDAHGAIDNSMAELTKIRDRAGRWAVWAEGLDSQNAEGEVAATSPQSKTEGA